MVFGVVLLVFALVACIWACVEYARCSWYTNCDLMGASLAFTGLWLVGTVFLSAGLALISLLQIGAAVAVGFGFAIAGKMFEWFVIEALLSWWFKDYRRGPA
jgi:hypothetical protein